MYIDLSCHSRTDTEDDVRESLFAAIKFKLNGISFLPHSLLSMKDFAVDGMDIASPIDYPFGMSATSVRSHAALSTIRRGVNTIDLVANNSLWFTKKKDKYYDDIETTQTLCKEHNITLRVILEYRLYEYKALIEMGNSLREMGIDYVFPSTGSQVDMWDDNLAISVELTNKCGINVITNGNIWRKDQFVAILDTNVFGARLTSVKSIENLM